MQQHPFIFSDERKYRIRRHAAFWIFWWLFQAFLYSFVATNSVDGYFARLPMSILESLIFLTLHIFLSYSLMYFVIPRFLLKQRYWHTVAWTIVCFFATAWLSVTVAIFVIDPLRIVMMPSEWLRQYRNSSVNIFLALMAGLRGGLTIGGIAAAIKLMKYWYLKEQRNMQLQKENIASQLQLLKAQVHPHFLFNTLNNIYSHTQNTAPVAAKMLTGLSDLLRFMLYECNQPMVPLSKEIKMVKDYIELEQIRYGNKLDLHIAIPENTHDLHVAPLLLLPLIENCFKHGTSHILEHPWINLEIALHGKWMHMKLMNGKVSDPGPASPQHGAGIGIQNVRKRLELLYAGKHELSITNDEDVFIVNLKVALDHKKEFINRQNKAASLIHV